MGRPAGSQACVSRGRGSARWPGAAWRASPTGTPVLRAARFPRRLPGLTRPCPCSSQRGPQTTGLGSVCPAGAEQEVEAASCHSELRDTSRGWGAVPQQEGLGAGNTRWATGHLHQLSPWPPARPWSSVHRQLFPLWGEASGGPQHSSSLPGGPAPAHWPEHHPPCDRQRRAPKPLRNRPPWASPRDTENSAQRRPTLTAGSGGPSDGVAEGSCALPRGEEDRAP